MRSPGSTRARMEIDWTTCKQSFRATEERAVGEIPRKRCEDFFLDQFCSAPG